MLNAILAQEGADYMDENEKIAVNSDAMVRALTLMKELQDANAISVTPGGQPDTDEVVLTLLVSACVGYGFAVYDFKLKNTAFIGVLLIMSIPFEILMLPLYTQINDMGLGDRYMAIMLPFLANAATIFFFRQYLSSVPLAIIESGRIDGASEYRIFAKLIVPIMKPAFAAMAILNGMNSWNNFLWPLLALHSDRKYTLPIGLNTLVTPYGNNYDLLIVGSFFSIVPVLILFLLFQKYFIEGMVAGAVKG